MYVLKSLCSATALAAMLAAPTVARADDYNKLTKLTFSGPVQVPGHTLPAGTYTFKLADSNNRHVVRISDKSDMKVIATLLAIPDQRLDPADKPIVMFKETPAGMPPAIQAWFYPGNTIGEEFVYPRAQAVRIAKATHRSVLSMADNSANESDMRSAQVGRVGENGEPADETTTAAPPPAPAPTTTSGTTGSTAAPMRRARRLPQTASPLALYELMSGLALAGAFGIRRFTR